MATTTPPIPTRVNASTIDQTWFNVLKTVLEDHESRLGSLSNEKQRFSFLNRGWVRPTGFPIQMAQVQIVENITLLTPQLIVINPGVDPTNTNIKLECDFLFKRGAAAYQSVLTTKPSLLIADGSLVTSTNGVINPVYANLVPGDWLRFDITSLQQDIVDFEAQLIYQKAS